MLRDLIMTHINELATILNRTLNWHKSRATCLAQMVCGLIAVKTVNLSQIALAFCSKSKPTSSYRRIQRFFSGFSFDPASIADIILPLIPKHKFHIIIDRTNWMFGSKHLNLLFVALAYRSIAIPIYWMNLAKAGTSRSDHRIFALIKTCYRLGKKRLGTLIADREFVRKQWFSWLIESEIDFVIRIKNNTLIQRFPGQKPTHAKSVFNSLRPQGRRRLKAPFWIEGAPFYLSASRSPEGELLVVAAPRYNNRALGMYKRRWEVENLFSALKTRGLNLEDTHLTGARRVEKLIFVAVLAFVWGYLLGISQCKHQTYKLYPRRSIFREGYDLLRQASLLGHLSMYLHFLE